MGREWKRQHEKNNGTTFEGSVERRETKEALIKGKTIHTKQDIPKQRKTILSTIGRAWHKNIPTTTRQRNRVILVENMAIEKTWRKGWMDKRYDKRTSRTQGWHRNGNIHRITQTDTKKISNWKTPGHDGIHGFWFKKFTAIHDRLALEMNRRLQDAQVPDWMTNGKTTLI